jgi:hypothetical protein
MIMHVAHSGQLCLPHVRPFGRSEAPCCDLGIRAFSAAARDGAAISVPLLLGQVRQKSLRRSEPRRALLQKTVYFDVIHATWAVDDLAARLAMSDAAR